VRPDLLAEFRDACDHDFAHVATKQRRVGEWTLPVTYYRCERCGYREVAHYVFDLSLGGPTPPRQQREPV
jgi:hypothetical protein